MLRVSVCPNLFGVFLVFYQTSLSSANFRTAFFREYRNNLTQGINKDNTAGVSLQGIMDCAKQTISTDGLGFFYKFKTKRCMTFREGPKSLEKMPEYYWLNTAKENHCSNSSGLIKWKSDGRCFVTSQNEASVDDATTICRNLYKGTLAVLSNAQRIRDMNVCLKTYDVEDEYWIGLKVGRKGNVWANGKPIDKNTVWPWASTRRGGKCYLAHKYSARWKWANQACPTSIFFICDHPCNT